MRTLKLGEGTNIINLTDDQPELLFGPDAMLDSGASYNLMPIVIMEKQGLDVKIPYKCLYSFDSSKVRCLGLIKDLCVTLTQIPTKTMLMDIVVADIPPKYGMLLSRSLGWGELQRTMQMDMNYETIHVFVQ